MTESGKRLLEGLHLHGGHDTGFCDWRPEPHIAAIEAEAVAARNAEIAAAVAYVDCHCAGSFATGHEATCPIPAILALVERAP